MACVASKFIYNFDVYCEKRITMGGGLVPPVPSVECNWVKRVVLKIIEGIENKGYVVFIDNYFTWLSFFNKFLDKRIYATCTARNNQICLPLHLADIKQLDKNVQGTMDWHMHDSKLKKWVM